MKIIFIDRCGARRETKAAVGATLLDVAKEYDVDGVEGNFFFRFVDAK